MIRLDKTCGPENWQNRYSHVTEKGVVCEIGINISGEWIWKSNGAGETDIEGEKGALSDAFKRAGVMWGIGRYLYKLPNTWIPLHNNGQSFKMNNGIPEGIKLPKFAIPEE